MGIIKEDDLIAWRDRHTILCPECGDRVEEAKPLTEGDFDEGDIVTCDECEKRIR